MQKVLTIILRHKISLLIVCAAVLIAGAVALRLLSLRVTASSPEHSQTTKSKLGGASSTPSVSDTSTHSGTPPSSATQQSATPSSTKKNTATTTTGSSNTSGGTTATPAAPAQTIPTSPVYCGTYPSVPNSSCTGWRHTGVTLQSVPEQLTSGTGWSWEGSPFNYLKITGDGAILDSLDIHGCVYVDNSVGVQNVTVKRSRVTGSCDYLFRLGDFNSSVNLQLQDTELIGSAVQMKGSGFSWTRVDSYNFTGKAAMMGADTVVRDSYIHDNVCNPPDHQSGIGTNGGATHIQMIHNNIDLLPGDCTSGGIANYDDFGAFSDVLIQNNLINSAGYCLKAGFEQGSLSGNTMRVIDNTFGRKYYPECGYWGVVSNWLNGSGNVWSGNVWGGGAAATSSHALGSPVIP